MNAKTKGLAKNNKLKYSTSEAEKNKNEQNIGNHYPPRMSSIKFSQFA